MQHSWRATFFVRGCLALFIRAMHLKLFFASSMPIFVNFIPGCPFVWLAVFKQALYWRVGAVAGGGCPLRQTSMKPPSLKNVFLLLVAGIGGTFVWSYLSSLSLALLIPLLQLAYEFHCSPDWVSSLFWSLFSLASAALFVFPLWLLMRRTLYVSAAIFISAFLGVLIVPLLLSNQDSLLDALLGISALWQFAFSFAFLVFLAHRFTKRQNIQGYTE